MPTEESFARQKQEAWIGDAVLTLFARVHILETTGKLDATLASQMTSNHFLSALGEPTSVEAEIGRAYQRGGLAEAFAWIEARCLTLFRRQQEKRQRKIARNVPARSRPDLKP